MCSRLQWSATAILLLALSCTKAASEPTADPDLEVYSWWKSVGERAAFEALVTPFKLQHPGAKVENVHRENSMAARGDLGGLLLLGAPPNTFVANAGSDVLRWAAVDYEPVGSEPGGAPEEGFSLLADVGPLLRRTGALDAMYPEVRRSVCARVGEEEQYYAVPVNVHRINLLYFNRQLVQDLGQAPETLFTLENLCPANLTAEDLPFSVSIAAIDNFSLLLLTFENLLLAVGGPSPYEAFFTGQPASTWRPEMTRVLGCLWHMSRSFKNVGEWFLAVNDVAAEQAVVTVMGDWANPEFVAAVGDAELDDVVGHMPFPGTESYFAFTSDSFPEPLEASSPEYTQALLRSFANFDTQLAFSRVKGSIPALRSGVVAPDLDAWALDSFQAFEAPDRIKVLGTSGFFPSYVSQARISEELRALTDVDTVDNVPAAIDRVLDLLESAVPLFRTWQERLQPCE